ncbi:hypothetical protein AYI70_g9048 [Smittium culicis]|uniref:CCHC-type domain-containing protein n=1 Tax=Smittium culicis TaxID=133412 RepID=A0A1R1XD50_9FUNG|nr:hypothetical protein AYI70_g9048 [Smittium culicis]
MTLTSRSDFNTFIQKIRPVIQLVAKTNFTLSIVILRQQVDREIKRFLCSNPIYRPADVSNSMDLYTISAPIRRANNYSRPNSPLTFRTRSPNNLRNRNMQPHSPGNSTMTPIQFEQYVKNCICFSFGKKGHLKTMCASNIMHFRNFNIVEASENNSEMQGNDQA